MLNDKSDSSQAVNVSWSLNKWVASTPKLFLNGLTRRRERMNENKTNLCLIKTFVKNEDVANYIFFIKLDDICEKKGR